MSIQIIVWSALMLLLLIGFVLRVAVEVRATCGNNKIVEVADEFEIYDLTEDEA